MLLPPLLPGNDSLDASRWRGMGGRAEVLPRQVFQCSMGGTGHCRLGSFSSCGPDPLSYSSLQRTASASACFSGLTFCVAGTRALIGNLTASSSAGALAVLGRALAGSRLVFGVAAGPVFVLSRSS